jgi:hypothetical protein
MEEIVKNIIEWALALIVKYKYPLLALLALSIVGIITEKIFEIKLIRHILIGFVVVVLAWLAFNYFLSK